MCGMNQNRLFTRPRRLQMNTADACTALLCLAQLYAGLSDDDKRWLLYLAQEVRREPDFIDGLPGEKAQLVRQTLFTYSGQVKVGDIWMDSLHLVSILRAAQAPNATPEAIARLLALPPATQQLLETYFPGAIFAVKARVIASLAG